MAGMDGKSKKGKGSDVYLNGAFLKAMKAPEWAFLWCCGPDCADEQ